MVSSIGSVASSMFLQYQNLQAGSDALSTQQGQSFEELIGMGKISQDDGSSSMSITALPSVSSSGGSSASSSSSSSSNSEMDLNGDGVVTSDEVMQYIAMQMSEKVQEDIASDEASDNMAQNENQNQQQHKSGVENFKTQMASQAYQFGENLLTASIGTVTKSFVL